MRCKPGDLAIVVGAKVPENNVKTVVVGKFLGKVKGWKGDDRWEIDKTLKGTLGTECCHCQDKKLLPITPPPGSVTEDEVTELFNPTKETA